MRKKAIVGLAVLLLVVTGAMIYGVAAAVGSLTGKQAKDDFVAEYQYTELGQECKAVAISYEAAAVAKSEELEVNNADMLTKIAQVQAKIYGNAEATTESINKARTGYENAYAQGYMSKEEYDNKMLQTDQAQLTHGTPSSAAQQQLDSIEASRAQLYADTKQEIEDMETAATKLQSCAESASQRKDFTVTDVAEFQALINNLN